MELEELSKELKKASSFIDWIIDGVENKSGEKCAKEYVRENHLEYIEKEILWAFKTGFIIGIRQEKSGRFEE